MDHKSELKALGANVEADDVVACRELRLYRPDGTLSVIYLATFHSDAKAISDAKKIAQYGYQVDVWRDEMRVDRVSVPDDSDTSNRQRVGHS